jgi:hypothetical protein
MSLRPDEDEKAPILEINAMAFNYAQKRAEHGS